MQSLKYWDQLKNLIEKRLVRSEKMFTHKSPEQLLKQLEFSLTDEGLGPDAIIGYLDELLEYVPNTMHPQFNNQLYGGFDSSAFLGEIVSFISNTSMSTYEISPVWTLMENKLLEFIALKLGFKTHDGIMLTGGSNANMMAVHCARNLSVENCNQNGANPIHHIYVSEDAHYSFSKAVILMGMGTKNLIKIKTTDENKMCPEDLEQKVRDSTKQGATPLLVASTSGTTVFGAFDDIEKINLVAKEYNLWHHVDGAWGGPGIFSKSFNKQFSGIEKVNSFVVDFHKLFGTGLITSFFIVNDETSLKNATRITDGTYLFHDYEGQEYDLGTKSLQCGRKNDVLKAWLYIKHLGTEGLAKVIDERIALRDYIVGRIKESPDFVLISEPEFFNICFYSKKTDPKKRRYELIEKGLAMVNFSTTKDGQDFYRLTLANNRFNREDADVLLELLV